MKICKRVSKRCSACPAGSLGSHLWCWKLILPSSAQGRYCWSTWISYHGFLMLCFTPGTASISFQTRHFLGAGVRPAFFSRAGCTELSCAELEPQPLSTPVKVKGCHLLLWVLCGAGMGMVAWE